MSYRNVWHAAGAAVVRKGKRKGSGGAGMKKKPSYYSPKTMRGMKGRTSSCTCYHGHVHHSRLEAGHCTILEDMLKKKEIINIERQVNLSLVVNGVLICKHIPDYIITYPDLHREIIESKGFETTEWVFKKRLTEALYPELKYNVWRK